MTSLCSACSAPPLSDAALFTKVQSSMEALDDTRPTDPPLLAALLDKCRCVKRRGRGEAAMGL